MARAELLARGIEDETVDSAQLALSELVGNSVRAYGDYVPLVVEVYVTAHGVAVNVHDPDPGALPMRRATPLDSAQARRRAWAGPSRAACAGMERAEVGDWEAGALPGGRRTWVGLKGPAQVLAA
ncbi:hypothetical protein ABTZ93_08115 [Streptomyces sp. NPDC097941]|uniref:hypothetical protein n=1 Tax=Streptomyces sp. NPDC097941 TaxID=3155685 RepID=UPI00331BBA6D